MKQNGKTALITGASSGIGLALARVFAREGYRLVLVARREAALRACADELESSLGAHCLVLAQDLCEPEAGSQLLAALDARGLAIDVLVNNAGYAVYGDFAAGDAAFEFGQVELNVVALTRLLQVVVPRMRAQGGGKVLNVASVAGFQPGPHMAVYFASKAYVISLSEALHDELKAEGIGVTALCPGSVDSPLHEIAHTLDSRYYRYAPMMQPAAVAEAGYRGLMRGERLVIPGALNRLQAMASTYSPRRVRGPVLEWLLRRRAGR